MTAPGRSSSITWPGAPRTLSPVRFRTALVPVDVGTFVEIPPEAIEALGATGRTSVVGTIDGHPFKNQVMPYTFEGEGRKVVMVVNKATRGVIGKDGGDMVEFVLDRDERSRSADVIVPGELLEALAGDAAATAAWPPSRRRVAASTPSTSPRPSARTRASAGRPRPWSASAAEGCVAAWWGAAPARHRAATAARQRRSITVIDFDPPTTSREIRSRAVDQPRDSMTASPPRLP